MPTPLLIRSAMENGRWMALNARLRMSAMNATASVRIA
jgi:hypothetical protein